MNKTGIFLISLAILAAGLVYIRQTTQDNPEIDRRTSLGESENASNWKEFKPQSGLFKVMLPHPPQYAKDLVPIAGSDDKRRYDMYASEKINGTLFLISVITYPNESESSESVDILKQTVDELMRSKSDNKLMKLKENQFKALPSMDFSFKNGEFLVEGKVFIRGKTVFVLSYVTKKNEFDSSEFEQFVHSFELTDSTVPTLPVDSTVPALPKPIN